MTYKEINLDAIEGVITSSYDNRPLLYQFPRDGSIPPAYICLSEKGGVYAEFEEFFLDRLPPEVHYGRERRWYVNPRLSCQDLEDLLDEICDDLQIVYNGLTIEWDGDNKVGRLNPSAAKASERIRKICNNWEASKLDDYLDTSRAREIAGQNRSYWDD